MREILVPAAAAAAFFTAVLLRREILRQARSNPIRATHAEIFEDGFARALLVPAIPIAVSILLGIWGAAIATFDATAVAQLLTAMMMAVALPAIAGQLLLWAHRPLRLDPQVEGVIVERLRRAGAIVNEVWVSPTPIAVFWRFDLLSPAIIVGTRVLVWREALDRVAPQRFGGLALVGPTARFWGWALIPLSSATYVHARDPGSVLPWWPFIAVAALVGATALPTLATFFRKRRNVRTDSGVWEAIEGGLELGLAEAWLSASRSDGALAAWSSLQAWRRAGRRSLRAARLAGIDPRSVAAHAGVALARHNAALQDPGDIGFDEASTG